MTLIRLPAAHTARRPYEWTVGRFATVLRPPNKVFDFFVGCRTGKRPVPAQWETSQILLRVDFD